MDPDAYRFYLDHYDHHHFRADEEHINRNHRVAEAAVMCLLAGVEVRPSRLPQLSKDTRAIKQFAEPVYYLGKTIKRLNIDGLNKLRYARFIGLFFMGRAVIPYITQGMW